MVSLGHTAAAVSDKGLDKTPIRNWFFLFHNYGCLLNGGRSELIYTIYMSRVLCLAVMGRARGGIQTAIETGDALATAN